MASTARAGSRIDGYFRTANIAGEPVDADELPTVDIAREGVSGHPSTVTRVSLGRYYHYFDIPEDWLAGDTLEAEVSAVIGGTTYTQSLKTWEITTALLTPADNDCNIREIVRPEVARMEEVVPQRRQSVRVWQGQTATVELTFRNDAGQPVDLSVFATLGDGPGSSSGSSSIVGPCSPYDSNHDYRLKIRFREPFSSGGEILEVEGYASDAAAGTIQYHLPDEAVAKSQILYAFIGVFDNLRLVRGMESIVFVDRSDFAHQAYRRVGVPTVAEVRSRLRDSGTNDNYLLARVEHSLDEIAEATIKAVADWNHWSTNAGIGAYTTANFPEPDMIMFGVMANLYPMLADNYRRNHLAYQAAGVSVNDKDYGSIYDQLAASYRLEFNKTIRRTTAAAARRGWTGIVSSPYAHVGPGGSAPRRRSWY